MPDHGLRDWKDLPESEQLELREAYGRDPECQTGLCSMYAKMAQFSDWLERRGIRFGAADLPGRG
ncbi:MAG: hypothetical protein ACWA5A_07760 [Marinibacterium sp.]